LYFVPEILGLWILSYRDKRSCRCLWYVFVRRFNRKAMLATKRDFISEPGGGGLASGYAGTEVSCMLRLLCRAPPGRCWQFRQRLGGPA
jgi:hypothetical protein